MFALPVAYAAITSKKVSVWVQNVGFVAERKNMLKCSWVIDNVSQRGISKSDVT